MEKPGERTVCLLYCSAQQRQLQRRGVCQISGIYTWRSCDRSRDLFAVAMPTGGMDERQDESYV